MTSGGAHPHVTDQPDVHHLGTLKVDHTAIVLATMDNVFTIMGKLDLLAVLDGQKPRRNAIDVLNAIAAIDAIDSAVRVQAPDHRRCIP